MESSGRSSGRVRKKSAKLIMMEQSEEEFSTLTKSAKRKSDSDSDFKSPPKPESPKKKGSAGSIAGDEIKNTPAVKTSLAKSKILSPSSDYISTDADEEQPPLEIDTSVKTAKGKRKRKQSIKEDAEEADSMMASPTLPKLTPAAKKRKTELLKVKKGEDELPKALHIKPVKHDQNSDSDDDNRFNFVDASAEQEVYDMGADDDDEDFETEMAGVSGSGRKKHGGSNGDGGSDTDEWDKYGVSSDEDEISDSELQVAESMRGSQIPVLADYVPPEPKQRQRKPLPPTPSPPSVKETGKKKGAKGKNVQVKSVEKVKKEKKSAKETAASKKPRTTAYSLWCQSTRQHLKNDPNIDFAELSQKLGQLWQTVPAKKKQEFQKKARAIQRKQDRGIEVANGSQTGSTHMRSGQPQPVRVAPVATPPQQTVLSAPAGSPPYKVTGNAPIDAAAHLKLLGESLSTIGKRLQEHKGQIAVQGSLSVLLDSLLCALGPLTCLTNQVPELNVVPPEIHNSTLDSLAYIMPGIG